MSASQPLRPYADVANPSELYADCAATTAALRLPDRRDVIARSALRGAPSLSYGEYAGLGEPTKADVPDVHAAAARIARAIFGD